MNDNATAEAMARRLDQMESELRQVSSRLQAANRRLKTTWALCAVTLLGGLAVAVSPTAQAQFNITLTSLNNRLIAVEGKTAPLSYDSNSKLLTISGANVRIIDGTGSTLSTSGLGNLQVGYNRLIGLNDVRTGSHNLILGDEQNYSSSGGLIAGLHNMVAGDYATVTGGYVNLANGITSSVNSGSNNIASGNFSCVNGGYGNQATETDTTVSGGFQRTSSAVYQWTAGGLTQPQ